MFRHGAAQDAYLEGGVYLVVLRTGHECDDVALRYALQDVERGAYADTLMTRSKVAIENGRALLENARKLAADAFLQNNPGILPVPERHRVPEDSLSLDQVSRIRERQEGSRFKCKALSKTSQQYLDNLEKQNSNQAGLDASSVDTVFL